MARLRVAVVMGGVSCERDVSLRSGRCVAAALQQKGYEVVPIDLCCESIDEIVAVRPDVVFIALHGEFGEDGTIQALLEQAGLAFTGSGAVASRLGMDKVAAKRCFITHGVSTPPFRLISKLDTWGQLGRAMGEIGLPLVVKPLRQGSSIGVAIVEEIEAVVSALRDAFAYGDEVLLEQKIEGRELTVGVLAERALPIIEVRPRRPFFDREAKYVDPATLYITAPELDELTYGVVQDVAVRAHLAIGARDFSRVDLILAEDGRPFVLEVNTIPGLTERSLLPLAAQVAGLSFAELCDSIVRMALLRSPTAAADTASHLAEATAGREVVPPVVAASA